MNFKNKNFQRQSISCHNARGRECRQAMQTRQCGGIPADLIFCFFLIKQKEKEKNHGIRVRINEDNSPATKGTLINKVFYKDFSNAHKEAEKQKSRKAEGEFGHNARGRECRQAMQTRQCGGIPADLIFCFFFIKKKEKEKNHYPEMHIINMNARLYDPVIARFFSPDNFIQIPENSQALNRYSYALNCPLMYTDPTGNLYNPIYNTDGIYLGDTKEGFTGAPLIYEGKSKVEWSKMTAEQASKAYGLTELQKTDLSAEAFSKIYTQILDKGGFFTSKLMGKAVAVRNGNDMFNNPSENDFASGSYGIPSKVSVNQQHPSAKDLLTTVENIQNLLGVHELQGHGQYQFGTRFNTHHKAFELQLNHSTWDNTTSNYKAEVLKGYLYHYNREVPNARSSSEYLKYNNLMNLYKK